MSIQLREQLAELLRAMETFERIHEARMSRLEQRLSEIEKRRGPGRPRKDEHGK